MYRKMGGKSKKIVLWTYVETINLSKNPSAILVTPPSNNNSCEPNVTVKIIKNIAKVTVIIGGVATAAFSIPIIMGFGTAGIAAGSFAAAIQSSIGSVAGGSLFALLQSAGATGLLVTGASTTGASYSWCHSCNNRT